LRFGDVVTAVASLIIIFILILFPLSLVLTPALGNFEGFMLSAVVSFFLSAIIVGFIFTQKIWEARREAIAKIAVLFTVLVSVVVIMENAAATDWTPMTKEDYTKANPTATPSAFEWYIIERLAIVSDSFLNIVMVLPLVFIGLYIGSMLRKPTES